MKFDGISTWFLHVSTYGEGMDRITEKKEAMLVDVLAGVVVSVQDGMQHSDSFARFLKQLDVV